MNLLLVGCSFRDTPIDVREKLAFDGSKLSCALQSIDSRFDCEVVILSTCNRVELYLARPGAASPLSTEQVCQFLAEFHQMPAQVLSQHVYVKSHTDAVQHLFRVVSSLDSLIVGEGQIVGQVKKAYEVAQQQGTAGPALHALFRAALTTAKRVRTKTGISRGHVSVSSVAVDFVRQVFERFDDKTVLVIGAGKMGELTLKHLRSLNPRAILVANRSPEKAEEVAAGCGGQKIAWDQLDDALLRADIVLSTTGASEPIMTLPRFDRIMNRRTSGTIVVIDIAVPRDFDPRIHDGDRCFLFNIDDLQRIRERTLSDRRKHLQPAEVITELETRKFLADWNRRRSGPVIARLTEELERRRQAIVQNLLRSLNGKLEEADKRYIEGAFRLLQNQFLHGPISALAEEIPEAGQHTLLEAIRKLFRLEE